MITPTDAPDAGIAAPEEVVTGAIGLVTETLPPPALDPDDDCASGLVCRILDSARTTSAQPTRFCTSAFATAFFCPRSFI